MGDGQLSHLKGVLSAACLINPACLNYKSNILPGTLSHSPLHIHMPLILLINTECLGAIDIMPLYLYSLVSIFQGQGYFITTVIISRMFNINKVFIVHTKILQIVLVIPLSFFPPYPGKLLTRTWPCCSCQAEVAFVISVPRGHGCRGPERQGHAKLSTRYHLSVLTDCAYRQGLG